MTRATTSAKFNARHRELPHKSLRRSVQRSAKVDKSKRTSKFRLTRSAKKSGRPPRIDPWSVLGQANHLKAMFERFERDIDWQRLRSAKTTGDLDEAFGNADPYYLRRWFRPEYEDILRIVRERNFPKSSRRAQIRFLCDSLGGSGRVSFRRARDICSKERKHPSHQIIRREFYIECTCGYKGPALNGACRKCGTARMSLAARIGYASQLH